MLELLGFTLAELQHWLFIFARISVLFFTIEFFSANAIPAQMRIAVSALLAFLVSQIVPLPEILPVTFMMTIPFIFQEVAVGLAIGLSTKVIFESLRFAGFMIGRLMGLSMVTLVDPASDEQSQAIGLLFYYFTIFLFLSIDAHHFFIRTIFDSFYLIPLTEGSFSQLIPKYFIDMLVNVFLLGIKISAPVLTILFLQRVLLALISKVNPEMNVFVVGMPLGILVGLYIMSIYWPYFVVIFPKIVETLKTDVLTIEKLIGGY